MSQLARERARRWYRDPAVVDMVRAHDRDVAAQFARHCADLLEDSPVSVPTRGKLVDVGSASGELAAVIEERWPDLAYVGVDPDLHSIEVLNRAGRDNCQGVVGSAEQLESAVDPCTAEVLVSSLSMALWEHPVCGLSRCRDTLRSGGQMLIVDQLKCTDEFHTIGGSPLRQFRFDQYNASLTLEDINSLISSCLSRWGSTSVQPVKIRESKLAATAKHLPFTTFFALMFVKS